MKRLSALTILFSVWLLSSCSTLNITKQEQAQPLSTSFQIQGAIAAKNQQHGWIANFTWVQRGRKDYQIVLNGPLGSDTISITMHQGILTYRQGNKVMQSNDPETLLAKETGIRIPVSDLYDWIRGRPAPGPVTAITRAASGSDIILLKQAGFVIVYDKYEQHLPHKIRLEGNQLLIKIVIKNWNNN
jgi:outer membrane lipoprotein LolB